VRPPSLHITGGFSGFNDVSLSGNRAGLTPVTRLAQLRQGDYTLGLPLRLGLGAEIRGDTWAIAVDVSALLPRSNEYAANALVRSFTFGGMTPGRDERSEIDVTETKTVVNVALGFETKVTDSNWIRLGAFTDLTALPFSGTDEDLFVFPLNRFGAAFGWGSAFGAVDTTIGLRGAIGFGDTVRFIPADRFLGDFTVEETSARAFDLTLFFSAAVDVTKSMQSL
jgi:hypothetical protein